MRIGLLGRETVTAVHVNEEVRQAQRIDDSARGDDRLVGKHRHLAMDAIGVADHCEHFFYAVIEVGVIEFVHPVVSQKIFQRFFDMSVVLGISQGAADQHRRAVADVGSNHVAGSSGRLKCRSMAVTEWIRSSRESTSVPSRSKIRSLILRGSNWRWKWITGTL